MSVGETVNDGRWELWRTVCGSPRTLWGGLCVHRSGSFHRHGCDGGRASRRPLCDNGDSYTNPPSQEAADGMQLKAILNRIQKHRGFVYGSTRLVGDAPDLRLEVDIYPHRRSRPRCS